MLMWITGPEFQFKIGVGGLTTATTGGVTWEGTVNRFTVFTAGNPPTGSPALAYGTDHWVVVFRQADQLFVSRITSDLTSGWSAPTPLVHQDGAVSRPAVSLGSPSLAFVRYVRNAPGFQDLGYRFAVMYGHPSLGIVSAISRDGLTWSAPQRVSTDLWEKDPALAESTEPGGWGRFHAVLTHSVGGAQREFVYRSGDGESWSPMPSDPGIPGAGLPPATPAAVYGSTEPGYCNPGNYGEPVRSGTCYLLVVEPDAAGTALTELSVQKYDDDRCGLPLAPLARIPLRATNQPNVARVASPTARPAAAHGYTPIPCDNYVP